jgi:two-component system response regulator
MRSSENLKSDIVVVRDGEEALDFLLCRGVFQDSSLSHPVTLVFVGSEIAEGGGLEVLPEIKAKPETRAIPVVVMTSSGEERDVVECYKRGVNSYIQNLSTLRSSGRQSGPPVYIGW